MPRTPLAITVGPPPLGKNFLDPRTFLFHIYLFTFISLIFQKLARIPFFIQVKKNKKFNSFLVIVKNIARILIKILHNM